MILIRHYGMTASGFARASVKADSLEEYDETNAIYALGYRAPNYPVPAILPKHTKLVHLGYVSAENGFSIEAVFNQYVRIP